MTSRSVNEEAYADVMKVSGLIEMLRYRRPGFSSTEKKFIARFIVPTGARPDGYGNYVLRIGQSPVLWSCHTDTVHKDNGLQKLSISTTHIRLHQQADSNCLGADCTTGVWLMLQMIKAKVPGLYVFHRDEEVGTKGSRWIAKENKAMLEGIKYAIAFDRRGTNSIITRQFGGVCASKEFAKSIAPMLPPLYAADDTGVYTDTATYIDLIPECTNLSVGYMAEHTKFESQNIPHVIALRDCMIKFDHTKLVAKRDHTVRDYGYSGGYSRSNWTTEYSGGADGLRHLSILEDSATFEKYADRRDMVQLIEKYPHEIRDILEQLGYDHTMLWDEIAHLLPYAG